MGRDLLDRLLDHDAWTTRRVLELARSLSEDELDRDFDIGHRTFRETARHMARNLEVWTDLMAGRPVRSPAPAARALGDLQTRFAAAYEDFARVARAARDGGQLEDQYVDVLDTPPRRKSRAGTILHVITHNHAHRAELLHMLARLGVHEVIEGDVLSWEASLNDPTRGWPPEGSANDPIPG